MSLSVIHRSVESISGSAMDKLYKMPFLKLLIAFSFISLAQSLCQQPIPMENFVLKDYLGTWHVPAYNHTNSQDERIYRNSKCAKVVFQELDNGINYWNFHVLLGSNKAQFLEGNFIIPDANRGSLILYTGNTFYNFTVLCTDYTSYAAIYACAELVPGYFSEWVVFHLRDPDNYNVISKKELQNCYSHVPFSSPTELAKRPLIYCDEKITKTLGIITDPSDVDN